MLAIAAAAVVIIAAAAFFFINRSQAPQIGGNGTAETANPPPAAAGGELMVAGPLGDMALGDPKAPNVVIEYASMTCTHCQRFSQEVFPEFKKKYVDTGKAYYIFRDFPLDPLATSAIMLAHCGPKERFFPLVDLLFAQQANWAFVNDPSTALQNLVKQAGISQDEFKACLTNQQILDGVNWVKNRGSKEFGIDATPTFFINGQKKPGEQTLEDFAKAFGS
jgi:protein-disulfide isomerase